MFDEMFKPHAQRILIHPTIVLYGKSGTSRGSRLQFISHSFSFVDKERREAASTCADAAHTGDACASFSTYNSADLVFSLSRQDCPRLLDCTQGCFIHVIDCSGIKLVFVQHHFQDVIKSVNIFLVEASCSSYACPFWSAVAERWVSGHEISEPLPSGTFLVSIKLVSQ